MFVHACVSAPSLKYVDAKKKNSVRLVYITQNSSPFLRGTNTGGQILLSSQASLQRTFISATRILPMFSCLTAEGVLLLLSKNANGQVLIRHTFKVSFWLFLCVDLYILLSALFYPLFYCVLSDQESSRLALH